MASGTIKTGAPTEVTITTVTTGWTSNTTSCYKMGNLVLVQFYVQGTPSNGKQIATGLPIPTSTPRTASGSSPSVIQIDNNGELYIQSAGTGIYMGGTLVYMTS